MNTTSGALLRKALFVSLAHVFMVSIDVAQNGVTVVDSLNPRHGGPGPSYGFHFASCWGYVAPDGHEYALIGCYSGTSIVDLDASPIHEVAYVPGSNPLYQDGQTYLWNVWIKDEFTAVSSQGTFRFVFRSSSRGVSDDAAALTRFILSRNYPNPFNPPTTISHNVLVNSKITIKGVQCVGSGDSKRNEEADHLEMTGENLRGAPVHGARFLCMDICISSSGFLISV